MGVFPTAPLIRTISFSPETPAGKGGEVPTIAQKQKVSRCTQPGTWAGNESMLRNGEGKQQGWVIPHARTFPRAGNTCEAGRDLDLLLV